MNDDSIHPDPATPGTDSSGYTPTAHPGPDMPRGRQRFQSTGSVDDHPPASFRDVVLDREVTARVVDHAKSEALLQEARFLARLDHIGASGVLDLVCDEAGAMLVTRRTSGITLAEAIDLAGRGQVPQELKTTADALRTMLAVGDIIARAHAQGVVHRALTTRQINLGGHGQVTIGDWSAAMVDQRAPATLRYIASQRIQRPERLHLDGHHDDIRALGACLAESLLLRSVDPTAPDPLGHISAPERERFHPALEAIVRTSLASDPSQGYQSVDDLSADLRGFAQAALPTWYAPGPLAAARDWVHRRKGVAGLAAAVLVAVCIAVVLPWLRPWEEGIAWSQVVAEDFAAPSWRERWIEPPSPNGMFAPADGKLVSTAPRDAFLIYRRRLTTPVAIEYTGEMLPGSLPCDLSVQWSEASGIAEDPARFARDGRSFMIQAGAFGNSFCAIFENPGRRLLAYSNRQLAVGTAYRFRVVLTGTRIALYIDDALVLEHDDPMPTQSGFISLYGFYPGKAFSDVRILSGTPANQPTVLALGDDAFIRGRYQESAEHYAAVVEQVEDPALLQQALFRQGLAEWHLGSTERASASWDRIADPDLRTQIACLRLETPATNGPKNPHVTQFEEQYLAHPEQRERLRRTWINIVQQWGNSSSPNAPAIASFIDVHQRLFPDDQACRYVAAMRLLSLRRHQEVIDTYPDQRSALARAMLALGRSRDLVESDWVGTDERVHALMMRGEFEEALRIPGMFPSARVTALIHTQRLDEALAAEGGAHAALLRLGRAAEILERPDVSGAAANEALICLGRWNEAAGSGLAQIPSSGSSSVAMLLLGHLDLAEVAAKKTFPAIRFMRAAETGNDQDYLRYHDQIVLPPDLAGSSGWFAPVLMRPFVDVLHGDPTAWETQTRPHLDLLSGCYGTTPSVVVRAILGDIPLHQVADLPRTFEAEAWTALASGMKAELAGDHDGAIGHYRAFLALPLPKRLLVGNLPDPEVEWFVAWRLRALSAGTSP